MPLLIATIYDQRSFASHLSLFERRQNYFILFIVILSFFLIAEIKYRWSFVIYCRYFCAGIIPLRSLSTNN